MFHRRPTVAGEVIEETLGLGGPGTTEGTQSLGSSTQARRDARIPFEMEERENLGPAAQVIARRFWAQVVVPRPAGLAES